MKKIALFLAFLVQALTLSAGEARQIFHRAYESLDDKASVFRIGGEWLPYPKYSDRKAWKVLLGSDADKWIKSAEKRLDYEYKYIPASMYLEYEKIKERKLYSDDSENRDALKDLFLGELAEGKGRFLPKIIDGVFLAANAPTWSHPQHTTNQNTHRTLPDPDDRYLSLLSANQAARLAFIWHFLHSEFDKYDPVISKMLLSALDKNVFTPYLDRNKIKNHGWMGFGNGKRNNWNTYCNTYIATAFLLACQDQARLLDAMSLVTESFDNYMDYAKMDGACEEGPSYWGMAGAKVYDFAKLMLYASKGKMNLLNDIQIRRMGEWRSAITVGDDWLIAFGDGFARNESDAGLIWRFGNDTGSEPMKNLALYLLVGNDGNMKALTTGESTDVFRILEQARYKADIRRDYDEFVKKCGGDPDKMRSSLISGFKSFYYDQTEFASLRNAGGWFLGVKGGYNGESHNHNDLGSGALFIDACPVLIDPGVCTYGPRFYEGKQYGYWNKYSQWHNTPTINGTEQSAGAAFKAAGSSCDVNSNEFTTDIAGAYGPEAACRSWRRSWALGENELVITDEFTLSERKAADVVNFIVQGDVTLPGEKSGNYKVKSNELLVSVHSFKGDRSFKVRMTFPKGLTATKETLILKDPRMTKVWGDKIERICLTAGEKAPLAGTYQYKVTIF